MKGFDFSVRFRKSHDDDDDVVPPEGAIDLSWLGFTD